MRLCSVFGTAGDKPPHGARGPKVCANANRQQPPPHPPMEACLTAAGTDATWLGPALSPPEPNGRINSSQAAAAEPVTSACTCPKLQRLRTQPECSGPDRTAPSLCGSEFPLLALSHGGKRSWKFPWMEKALLFYFLFFSFLKHLDPVLDVDQSPFRALDPR